MTEAEARERIEAMTAWDAAPALTSAQVTLLVRAARRTDADGITPTGYDEWQASTVYAVGDRVYPSVRTGLVYEVTGAGTSGAAEPSWPSVVGGTVTADGVTYEAVTDTWTGTYDLNAAAAEGWRWKAAVAAGKFSFSSDGQSFNRAEISRAAREMATMYRNRVAGSVPLVLSTPDSDVVANA